MATGGQYRNSIDLINETLANLGVLVAGQVADVEDFNYVQEKMDAVFRKLNDLEICDIPDHDAIPGQWFSDLADILAGETCTKFGASGDQYVMLINKGLGGVQGVDVGQGAAAKSLRQMRRGRPTGEVLVTEYF
jgi:hypothetical protein